MNENNKNFIHYRTLSKSNHLASDDLIGSDPITVTVKRAYVGQDLNKRVKEPRAILEFVEKTTPEGTPLKPMLLNMTNANAVAKISGTPNVLAWADALASQNKKIEIYVQGGIKLGNEVVDGLRIRAARQAKPKQPLNELGLTKMAEAIKTGRYSKEAAFSTYSLTPEQASVINSIGNEEAANA